MDLDAYVPFMGFECLQSCIIALTKILSGNILCMLYNVGAPRQRLAGAKRRLVFK
jgi:hypothetical protein